MRIRRLRTSLSESLSHRVAQQHRQFEELLDRSANVNLDLGCRSRRSPWSSSRGESAQAIDQLL